MIGLSLSTQAELSVTLEPEETSRFIYEPFNLLLKAGDAAAAVAQMELAETALRENAEELFLVITMLHGLPSIEVLSSSPEELSLLLEVLSFASEQRSLSRQTEVAQGRGGRRVGFMSQHGTGDCVEGLVSHTGL